MRGRHAHRRRARRRSSATPARPRALRRHVHRQHDGVGRRGASACRCPAASSPPAVDRRRDDFAYESGEAVVRPARARHPAAPDHDQGGVRERHRRHRWRSAARPTPCCTCWRSRNEARVELDARRLQQGRGARAAHRRHEAARQVPHGRPRPHRRRAGGDEGTCSTPACCTATASPSPARPWPRTSADLDPPGARRQGRPPARPTRSTPTAASPCSRDRWPRRARS